MTYFSPRELLDKTPPTRRASYSDRTAWLMAELSRLAYLKFEPAEDVIEKYVAKLTEASEAGAVRGALKRLLREQVSLSEAGAARLESTLREADFELVRAFSRGGTQAFLAKRDADRIAVLAFRGTEATELDDIKADINAIVTNEAGARTHSGFLRAFRLVEAEIGDELEKLRQPDGYALYVTGHSLGGALALIATRTFDGDNLAACYTFGSPRVASSEFGEAIKTPIYRVVNTADIVPRLPPGLAIELAVDALRLLRRVLPFAELIADWLDNSVSGYRHHGDMRYLTNCLAADCSDVHLIANIGFLDRVRRLVKSRISLSRRVEDHAIDAYCRKLAAYALKRAR